MPAVIRRSLPLALLLTVLLHTSAFAATSQVTLGDPFFDPTVLNIKLGDSVFWLNMGNAVHTTSADFPFHLWNSPPMSAGQNFTYTFTAAGLYPYRCRFHPVLMRATVGVPDVALPKHGAAGTQFTITVATIDAPAGFVYDIQMKVPGGQFTDWMLGVTTASVTFDSTGMAAGTYSFHSRLTRTSDGSSSLYSPPSSVTIG